ncbi:protein-L-isoaspartate(D-aspartate) O-methyltransferase [Sinosporangium album]|uniref:Protein-L-isoaspartate O-methyltransferase n=1 Tax=Sinosporangium album TaxID=504805 RepID=A0A1G8F4A8_9ACTN|nr:hypothetical protein [Sinosporangium album]SDH76927.1 protein-L-isoaspartate(D-aspartate) O-methyltransferase [Sinosporangium album]
MGTVTTTDGQAAENLIARLTGQLREQGALTEPQWATALREVPRHLFIPETAWFTANHAGAPKGRFALHDDPAAWWSAVYSDTSVILQTDDGEGDPLSGKGTFSSSVSAPGIVIPFLQLLTPRKGDRILEIGTGSGWTAALLSWAAGHDGITSIEVDAQVAAQAAATLQKAGYAPNLIVGDGVKGCLERAPYDRVHVTAGVAHIPMAWIEQTRPGGTIVMPWHGSGRIGHQLRLTVLNNTTAVGRFHGTASFMMLREQRYNARWSSHCYEEADVSTTELHPRTLGEADLGAQLMFAALAPRVGWHDVSDGTAYSLLMYELDDQEATGSWAACDFEPGAVEFQVTQYGKRRLWDELSSAYLQWVSLGCPSYNRFGATVDRSGVHLWLDHPGASSWTMPVL